MPSREKVCVARWLTRVLYSCSEDATAVASQLCLERRVGEEGYQAGKVDLIPLLVPTGTVILKGMGSLAEY